MESFFSRYKNELVLMGVLFVQIIILASNVERDNPRVQSQARVSLIRVWTVNLITPVERVFVSTGHFFRDTWRSYVDLHDVRRENRQLQEEVNSLRTEQARLKENVSEVQRLKALLDFKERYIGQTVAAQVIGSSGSEQSRSVYIDKGERAGIKPDMAVITPDGIVGKIKEVFAFSSQVLLINDHDSGAGVILEKSRLQGVLKGSGISDLAVRYIMADEKVELGENVITSGGDGIYPKGLPVGSVSSFLPDRDSFLDIRVKPAADLSRLEEVLVVTKIVEQTPMAPETAGHVRAADILAERLPTVPKPDEPKPENKPAGASPATSVPPAASASAKRAAGEQPGSPVANPQRLKKQGAPGVVPAQTAPPVGDRKATTETGSVSGSPAANPQRLKKQAVPGTVPAPPTPPPGDRKPTAERPPR
ncbi:MAG: rod shape-determining protein MreC [Acidobacteriia bacterium]|nr:rod shape-determining protein MreC [Terriglobia bacterium]